MDNKKIYQPDEVAAKVLDTVKDILAARNLEKTEGAAHKRHHDDLESRVDKLVDIEEKEHGKDIDGDGKIAKKQGAPEGVDPAKQEKCVKEVKKDPKIDNPYAVCNASMKKGEKLRKYMEKKELRKGCVKKSNKLSKFLEKKRMRKGIGPNMGTVDMNMPGAVGNTRGEM